MNKGGLFYQIYERGGFGIKSQIQLEFQKFNQLGNNLGVLGLELISHRGNFVSQ